jgi:hypothetical protein
MSTMLLNFERNLTMNDSRQETAAFVAALRCEVGLLESALEEAQEKLGGSVRAWVAEELRLALLDAQVCATSLPAASFRG